MQDLRVFFRKTNIFLFEKKKKALHLVNQHFAMEKMLFKSPVGNICGGTSPQRWNCNMCPTQLGSLGTGSFPAPRVMELPQSPVRN